MERICVDPRVDRTFVLRELERALVERSGEDVETFHSPVSARSTPAKRQLHAATSTNARIGMIPV